MSKLHKRSANDENRWDCYCTFNKQNPSASGEVGARKNMAEKYKLDFIPFLELDQFQI